MNQITFADMEYSNRKKPNGLNWDKKMEYDKSSVRCKIEHSFLIVKNQMDYVKIEYRVNEKT